MVAIAPITLISKPLAEGALLGKISKAQVMQAIAGWCRAPLRPRQRLAQDQV
jgi:hypothetical protein